MLDKDLLLNQIDDAKKVFVREWDDDDNIFLPMRLHEHVLAVFVSQLERLSRDEVNGAVTATEIGEYVCNFFGDFVDDGRWDY